MSENTQETEFNIFISYRRSDTSGYAGRLYDVLRTRFGREHVFMDISAINPGEEFTETVKAAIGRCAILIVVIGRNWLTSATDTGRRLDNANDLLRLEVATALSRKIRVIPVLVQGAAMPQAEELPDEIKSLAFRNALEISDSRWDYDVERLVSIIETLIRKPFRRRVLSPLVLGTGGALLALAIVAGLIAWLASSRSDSSNNNTTTASSQPSPAANSNAGPANNNTVSSNKIPVAPPVNLNGDAAKGTDVTEAQTRPTPSGTPVVSNSIRYAAGAKDISSLKPEVARLAKKFVDLARERGIEVIIVKTLVTFEEQDEMFAQGRTKPGPIITRARGGQSNHNFGYSFDVYPFVNGKPDVDASQSTWDELGRIGKSLGLEWGGDWAQFIDKPHFQWGNKTVREQYDEYMKQREQGQK